MKSLTEHLWFEVAGRRGFINITPTIDELVGRSGVAEGLCLVNAMHITASVFINDDVELRGACRVAEKRVAHEIKRRQRPPMQRAYRDEKQGRIVPLEDLRKARRSPHDHASWCRGGCPYPQSPSMGGARGAAMTQPVSAPLCG